MLTYFFNAFDWEQRNSKSLIILDVSGVYSKRWQGKINKKKYPNISICMAPGIVHFYFFRFQHIIWEIQHFVFHIGSYETDRSAISLNVAAKTRTKPIEAPPRGQQGKRCQNGDCQFDIFVISSWNKPLHCSHGRYAHRWIWCLSLRCSNQTLELYHDQIPTRPAASVGTGWNETTGSYNFYVRTPA